ncbi:hypothetical protein [Orrella daihaiensis]|uniref:hypothetical protein n=1 Tax=Orrella daihaiensis TaxID=2782176 RepID=UPI001FB1BFEB|nr:hypothetical protein [Orrella daihaiensis]
MPNDYRIAFWLQPPRAPTLSIHPRRYPPTAGDQRLVWAMPSRSDNHQFSGAIRGSDLLLVGKCAEFQGDVARVIEAG